MHSSVLKPDFPHTTRQLLLPRKQREKQECVSSVRSQLLIFTSVVFAYSWRSGKTLLQQETSCLLPIWEDESIAKLTDNMQQDGGTGKRIPSEVQSIYRRPSSWAALMQFCNTRRQKQDVFPGRQQWTQWIWHLFQEVLPLSKFWTKPVCLRLCKEWSKHQSSPSFCRSGRLWVWQGVSSHVFSKVHFNFSL